MRDPQPDASQPPPPDDVVRTEQRYARPEADHLSDEAVAELAAGRTGATAATFFDLDKTVIARSSTLVMGRTFHRGGMLSNTALLRGAYTQLVYQLVGANHERMEQIRTAALELTRGWDAAHVRALVRETVEEVVGPLVFAEALELIDEHRAAGRDVWIVSTSGDEVVAPFCEHLGITDWVATRTGIDDEGRYDGTLEFYAYGQAKANAIQQLAEARGYDLAQCHAYSDSVTDLPMLSVVGHATAVNPDRDLRAAAGAMGWDVLEFTAPDRRRRDRSADDSSASDEGRGPDLAVLTAVALVFAAALVVRRQRRPRLTGSRAGR